MNSVCTMFDCDEKVPYGNIVQYGTAYHDNISKWQLMQYNTTY